MGSSVILPQPGQPVEGPDPGFKAGSIPAAVSFSLKDLSPPSMVYVQPGDALEVRAFNSQPGLNVIVAFRLLLAFGAQPGQPDAPSAEVAHKVVIPNVGTVVTFIDTWSPTSNRAFFAKVYPLAEGYLLDVCISNDGSVALRRGQCFNTVHLRRVGASTGAALMILLADYQENGSPIGWPGGRIQQPIESAGWSHSIQQANPAAGADWTLTVATNQRLSIKSFSATFVASATVATRNISVIIDDGANIVWQADVTVGVTAGQTVSVNGTTTNAVAGVITTTLFVVIPPLLFQPAGWRIRSSTGNIQVGDQWSNIWFAVEEWIEL